MPSAVLSEVIGFTAFVVLLSISLVYFTLHQSVIALNTDEVVLRDVAEYVATSLSSLVSMANSSAESEVFLAKVLNIPQDVNGKGYFITLENNSGILVVVVCYSDYMKQEARLWSCKNIDLDYKDLSQFNVEYVYEISSGMKNPVVWCWKKNGSLSIGLGILGG